MADRPEKPVNSNSDPVRARYERHGATEYYRAHAGDYVNPHESDISQAIALAVERWRPDVSHVLDLAAGTGEATLALRALGAENVDGCEPFLFEQYERRAGRPAERFSFEDVAAGALTGRQYSLIVCSFALHLAEPSRLPTVCYRLSEISPALLVLTPHKRPQLRPEWGWDLTGEFVWARVRCRCYRSSSGRNSVSDLT
jgi:hypothetical protein